MSYLDQLFAVKGKTAVVTGGATGIGRMAVEALVQAGAKVYLASRKFEACEAVANEMAPIAQRAGGACIALKADLSNEEGLLSFVEEIKQRETQLDILVNNAGVTWGASLEDFPWDAWQRVYTLFSLSVSS